MRSNTLQLNTLKTEILWSTISVVVLISCRSHYFELAPTMSCQLPSFVTSAYTSTLRSHVTKTVSACFAVLHQLRSVRRSVPRSVLQSLVTSLVLTRLDHGNATLTGIPLKRLQSAMNSVARWYFPHQGTRAHHTTPPSTTLVEGSGADRLQAGSPCP